MKSNRRVIVVLGGMIFGAQLVGFVLLALGGCSAPAPAPGWSAPYSSGVGPKVDGDRGY